MGVLLGVVGLAMSLFFFAVLLQEDRGFGTAPEQVDLKTVAPPPEMRGRWVSVTQPLKIYCQGIETENQAEHQLLFGRVDSTFFLAEVSGSPRYIVLQKYRKAKCPDVQQVPQVGVLTELNANLRGTLEGNGMVFPRDRMVMLQCLSCGPKESRNLLVVFLIMGASSLWLLNRFWRQFLRKKAWKEGTSIGSR